MIDIDLTKDWDITINEGTGTMDYTDGATADLSNITTDTDASVSTSGKYNLSPMRYMTVQMTADVPPSRYGTFRFYIKDFTGRRARYDLKNDDIGKELRIPMSTLTYESGFNRSNVIEVGFQLASPKSTYDNASITINTLMFGDTYPTYCTAQDVIDNIGMVDKKGEPLIITESTRPRKSQVEKWIVQAEDFCDRQCRGSWRENIVKDKLIDRPVPWKGTRTGGVGRNPFMLQESTGQGIIGKGHTFKLPHYNIRPIDPDKGDKIEMRGIGQEFTDITTDTSSYWLDHEGGRIFIRKWFMSSSSASLRITYRWGEDYVPQDISQLAILKASVKALQTDWFTRVLPQGPGFEPNKSQTINEWQQEIKDIVAGRMKGITMVGGI